MIVTPYLQEYDDNIVFIQKQKKAIKKELEELFRGFPIVWITEIHARGCLSSLRLRG